MGIHDMMDRIRRAYELEDWARVIELGESILREEPARAIAAGVHLFIGRALFSLGRGSDALSSFETGFESSPLPDDINVSEFAYFAGMASMISGDMERARAFLNMAIDRASTPTWAVDAALRGLAQVETELGSFDAALTCLERLPAGTDQENPFNHMLRARALTRQGKAREARWELSAAGRMLPDVEPGTPRSDLLAGANMLVGMAEVYLELGHTAQAHRALDACTEALERADWPEVPAAAYLLVFRAAAHRLDGRLTEAARLLDASTPHIHAAQDLEPVALREHARVAADRDEKDRAAELWREAAAAFDRIGYGHQAARTLAELTHGPPTAQPHPSAGEEFAAMAREAKPR